MLLQGTQAALQVRDWNAIRALGDVEFRVFSQWGEDGIIEWIVSRIPDIPQTVVEFGVEDYTESNTRFLVQHRNWRALVMDGSAANMNRLRSHRMYWHHDITAVVAFIDRENINGLISDHGFSGDIGILSIDLDGNDYWVWEAITVVSPWIVIAEYNTTLGDLKPLTIPYDQMFLRQDAHFSGQYFGASIRAIEKLADARNYTLLGSSRAGVNAFFVRNDVLCLLNGSVEDRKPVPALLRDGRAENGAMTYIGGIKRRDIIGSMTVHDIETGEKMPLASVGEIYSDRWKALLGD